MGNEDIVIPIAGMLFVVTLAIGLPLVVAYIRRAGKKAELPAMPPEAIARLERMEQAIDAIAVEVERISEGQRFTTKLLSERVGAEKKLNG
jgi:hypothetical protein